MANPIELFGLPKSLDYDEFRRLIEPLKGLGLSILIGILLLIGFYSLSIYSFLLFHFVVEIVGIAIMMSVFFLSWNSRHFLANGAFLFLGISSLFVAAIDVAHTLSYEGMGIFQGFDANLPTQLWVAARFLQGISFVLAFSVFLRRRLDEKHVGYVYMTYTAITALIFLTIFHWRIFPDAFIEGMGLTPFKILCEYVISLLFLLSGAFLLQNKKKISRLVTVPMLIAIGLFIAAEIFFTMYTGVYGGVNLIGHLLRILGLVLIYKALISIGLMNPYATLFHDLKRREAELNVNLRSLKAAKNETELEKLKTQAMLECVGDGLCAIDRDWNIILWNRSAERITGWAAREAIGKPFREIMKILRESDRKEHLVFIEEAMLLGEVRNMDDPCLLINKKGDEIPLGDSAAPIFDENGAVDGVIITFRDVSMERENARMRSDFVYASHQLRTPVTKAIWSAEALLSSRLSAKVREQVEDLHSNLKSVLKLVQQLVEVSSIENGLISLKSDKHDLGQAIASILEKKRPDIKRRDLKLSVAVKPDTVLYMDGKVLMRILDEVIDNAIVYSKHGGTISISADESGEDVTIRVKDDGIGIPEYEHPLVFTKFYRGSNFDTTEIVGAGLGITIVNEYLKMIGGKVWFESVVGKGTTVYISMPIDSDDR